MCCLLALISALRRKCNTPAQMQSKIIFCSKSTKLVNENFFMNTLRVTDG